MGALGLIACGFQRDFCERDGALAASGRSVEPIRAILGEAERVLAAARAAGIVVLHSPERALARGMSDSPAWRDQARLNGWTQPIAAEGEPGERILDAFAPLPGELVVPRHRPGALIDSRASVLLRSAGVDRVIVIGVELHRAVLATALQAVCLDYRVSVPRDAVGGSDAAAGRAALAALASWARVVATDELLAALPAPRPATGKE